MKASEKKGAKKRTKSPQFSKNIYGDESIRRRNNRAVYGKEKQKYAPFSYRKSTLRVLARNRHGEAANPQPNKP